MADSAPSLRVIGLMSGTSFDAVDAGAAELAFDGDVITLRPLGLVSRPYPAEIRDALADALPPSTASAAKLCELDTVIGQFFAEVAATAIDELADGTADLISSHGQTVFHWVEGGKARGTLQLGQPAWIAERTGCPVVSDLRSRDIAAGGQGAPLVGLFDVLWLRSRPGRPVALNLGGIANITVDLGTDRPLAYDTGPANALLDAAIRSVTGEPYDRDGARAARGTIQPELLDRLLAEPYYAAGRAEVDRQGTVQPRLPARIRARPRAGLARRRAGHADRTDRPQRGRRDRPARPDRGDRRRRRPAQPGPDRPAGRGPGAGATGPGRGARAGRSGQGGVPVRAARLPHRARSARLVPSATGARHPSVLGSITPGRGPLRTLPDPRPPKSLNSFCRPAAEFRPRRRVVLAWILR